MNFINFFYFLTSFFYLQPATKTTLNITHINNTTPFTALNLYKMLSFCPYVNPKAAVLDLKVNHLLSVVSVGAYVMFVAFV